MSMPGDIVLRFVYSVFTVYMMVILLYWLGPGLGISLYDSRWRWVHKLANPLVAALRKLLPGFGPMDFGPIAALLVLWLGRQLCVALLVSAGTSGGTPSPM